eukprot:403336894
MPPKKITNKNQQQKSSTTNNSNLKIQLSQKTTNISKHNTRNSNNNTSANQKRIIQEDSDEGNKDDQDYSEGEEEDTKAAVGKSSNNMEDNGIMGSKQPLHQSKLFPTGKNGGQTTNNITKARSRQQTGKRVGRNQVNKEQKTDNVPSNSCGISIRSNPIKKAQINVKRESQKQQSQKQAQESQKTVKQKQSQQIKPQVQKRVSNNDKLPPHSSQMPYDSGEDSPNKKQKKIQDVQIPPVMKPEDNVFVPPVIDEDMIMKALQEVEEEQNTNKKQNKNKRIKKQLHIPQADANSKNKPAGISKNKQKPKKLVKTESENVKQQDQEKIEVNGSSNRFDLDVMLADLIQDPVDTANCSNSKNTTNSLLAASNTDDTSELPLAQNGTEEASSLIQSSKHMQNSKNMGKTINRFQQNPSEDTLDILGFQLEQLQKPIELKQDRESFLLLESQNVSNRNTSLVQDVFDYEQYANSKKSEQITSNRLNSLEDDDSLSILKQQALMNIPMLQIATNSANICNLNVQNSLFGNVPSFAIPQSVEPMKIATIGQLHIEPELVKPKSKKKGGAIKRNQPPTEEQIELKNQKKIKKKSQIKKKKPVQNGQVNNDRTLADLTFQNPTVSAVKHMCKQVLMDELRLLKSKGEKQNFMMDLDFQKSFQNNQNQIGESQRKELFLENYFDEDELLNQQQHEGIRRLQDMIIQQTQKYETRNTTTMDMPFCMNQQEVELDVSGIFQSLNDLLMKRAQELQKVLEQERLEHSYCLRLMNYIKSEILSRNQKSIQQDQVQCQLFEYENDQNISNYHTLKVNEQILSKRSKHDYETESMSELQNESSSKKVVSNKRTVKAQDKSDKKLQKTENIQTVTTGTNLIKKKIDLWKYQQDDTIYEFEDQNTSSNNKINQQTTSKYQTDQLLRDKYLNSNQNQCRGGYQTNINTFSNNHSTFLSKNDTVSQVLNRYENITQNNQGYLNNINQFMQNAINSNDYDFIQQRDSM